MAGISRAKLQESKTFKMLSDRKRVGLLFKIKSRSDQRTKIKIMDILFLLLELAWMASLPLMVLAFIFYLERKK